MKRIFVLCWVMVLLTACTAPVSQNPPPVDTSTPEVDAAYADVPVLENGAGVKLRIGMRAADFEARLGVLPEDGWSTTVRDAQVMAMADAGVVVSLAAWGDWVPEGGAPVGASLDQVRAVCGAPDQDFLVPTDNPQMGWLTYDIGEQGQVIYRHMGDGVVNDISLVANMEENSQLKGYESAQASGEGQQTIAEFSNYNLKGEYLLISYEGKGKFELIATGADGKEKVLVSEKGPYEGRVEAPGFAPYGLKISAKGDWEIKARVDEPMQGAMEQIPS